MKLFLSDFSLRRPWLVLTVIAVLTAFAGLMFPKVHFDNDPENMLSADEPVRKFHSEIKARYALYDFVIVGVVNEQHEDGVFNVETLGRINTLTEQLLSLQRDQAGLPTVEAAGQRQVIDLEPSDIFSRVLNVAFRHDPNRLFDEAGGTVIINRELIAPSVVDNIKQAELGSLKLAYLMEEAPATREQALAIGADAMSNPLYAGTLVSEDRQAICLYIPIQAKHYSYNVAALVKRLTADWNERVLITGLPVAEDTFGVEMLIQMATSAPIAGLAVFLLLLFFFRRLTLIIAPMVVAVVSIVWTMGLLIGLGFDVHIMSSMIAIFLMPIAVADSVHILSEFYDTYHRFGNKADTVRHVVGHLFMPMLYTTLTTMAGFASLGTTPIPPVQVFGLHVAFGVGSAWLLTMTLIPAYLMIFVPESALAAIGTPEQAQHTGPMGRLLAAFGRFSYARAKVIPLVALVLMAIAGYGISRITVNDNPVKWFTPEHPVRVADEVLNAHFGGTYTAYLTFTQTEDAFSVEKLGQALTDRFAADNYPAEAQAALGEALQTARTHNNINSFFDALEAAGIETGAAADDALLDAVNYLDPAGLTTANLAARLKAEPGVDSAAAEQLAASLSAADASSGEALIEAALQKVEAGAGLSFPDWLNAARADLTAPAFKQPAMLRWLTSLQTALAEDPLVGKSSSAADALLKAHYELRYSAERDEAGNRNFYAVPDTAAGVGQVFTQLEGMKKKDSLFHLVTRDYRGSNIWVQLKSGDNRDMESVVTHVDDYIAANPPPVAVETGWAGLTYLNVVWQEKMVVGMLTSLAWSYLVVLIMMVILFRSLLFGLLSMIPLTVTISLIYGLIGLVGKDYDMPVAVLSALTLGLSVDFAIHFLQRSREMVKTFGSWPQAVEAMFKEPAAAISRNAVTISIGFTPLLFAPLIPYKTVGFFLATIMAVSWLATLFILPALLTLMQNCLFKGKGNGSASTDEQPAAE